MGLLVTVTNENGIRSKVQVHVSGLFSGGISEKKETNSRGEAYFHEGDGKYGTIFVDGSEAYKGKLSENHYVKR